MATVDRLTLNEYSQKHRVSISTLRRRIKSGQVDFQLDDGKYFLLDSPLDEQKDFLHQRATPMSLAPPQTNLGHRSMHSQLEESSGLEIPVESGRLSTVGVEGEGVFSTAKEILAELKKAYALILQEKEEQILLLKEEVIDLKTLCRVLEHENGRLRKQQPEPSPPITDWLDSLDDMG